MLLLITVGAGMECKFGNNYACHFRRALCATASLQQTEYVGARR